MQVTATEFKNNMGKYLAMVAMQEVFITKNGKCIAKVSNCEDDRVSMAKSLFGIIPNDGVSLNQVREERLARHERLT
ncbi:prevent-host-death protein [Clostridia bacterium]|nr:prevent-host-death protein [Clostridia bacterium]